MSSAPRPADSNPPKKSRFWRWLKRGLLVSLGLLVLAVVFHRQLLQWGLNWGGKYFAKREGYTLEWVLDGSILSDIKVSELKVRGPEGGVVANIAFHEAILRYDLWKLWKEGTGSFLKEVSLSDTTIEADIRTDPNRPKPPPEVKEKKPPPDFWVDRLNLQNISALIRTDEGDIVLRDFTLLLDKDRPGVLHIGELVVPSARIELRDVDGRTQVEGRKITLADLRVTPDVRISRLYTDLTKLHQGALDYELAAKSGAGSVSSKGRVEGLGTTLTLDSHLTIANLAHTEIARWASLPEGLAFVIGNADLKVKGDPARPQALDAEVVLKVSGVRAAGYGCDTVELLGTVKTGALNAGLLKVVSGPNAVEASSTVTLPSAWAQVGKAPVQVAWKIAAPDLAAVRESPVALKGRVQGTGQLELKEGKLTGATSVLDAKELTLPGLDLASVQADVSTDASVVKLNSLVVQVDPAGRNSASLTGQMGIAGRQSSQVEVQGNFTELRSLFQALKLEDPPASGEVAMRVTGSFDLADLKEKIFTKAFGSAELDLSGLQWRDGRLDKVRATLAVKDGVATLKSTLDHQGKNTAELNATLQLSGRQTTNVGWTLRLADLAGLVPLAGLKDVPPPTAGTVTSQGKAVLDLADLKQKQYAGAVVEGDLQVAGLQWRDGGLDHLTSTFHVRDSAVSLVARMEHQGKNTADIRAQVSLLDRQPAQVEWKTTLTDLASLLALAGLEGEKPRAGNVASEGRASFSLADLQEKNYSLASATGTLNATDLAWRGGALDRLNSTLALNGGALEVKASLDHQGKNNATLETKVLLTGNQEGTLNWRVHLTDLTSLMPLAGVSPPPTAGVVDSTGSASFRLVDLQRRNFNDAIADGSLAISGVQWNGGSVEAVQATIAIRTGIAEIKECVFRFDPENQGVIKGKVPLDTQQPFQAEMHVKLQRLPALAPWLAMAKAPAPVSGTVAIDLNAEGILAQGDVRGRGTVAVDNVKLQGRPEVYTLALKSEYGDRKAQISELRFSSGQLRLAASASVSETELVVPSLTLHSGDLKMLDGVIRVPLVLQQQPRPKVPVDHSRPLEVKLNMEKLNLAQVFGALGQKPPAEGTVTAALHLEGRLPELKGGLTATLTGVQVEAMKGKLDPAEATLSLQLVEDRAELEIAATQRPLQPLQVKAKLPFDVEEVLDGTQRFDDAPLDAEITLPQSSLDAIPRFVPALARLEGTVGLQMKISGTVQKPSWSGTLRTDVTSIALADVPMDVKDVKAHLDFQDTRVDLTNVSATVAGGKVKVGGRIDAADVKDPSFDLKLTADQALLVRDNTMSFRASADVTCKGTLARAAVVGRVDLVRGRVFKEVEFLPLSLPNQLPPPPPAVRAGKGGAPAGPSLLKDWTLDVAIKTRDPIRLLGNVLNGATLVDVRVGGTGAAPTLEGKASLDGARLLLPFSRLAITRGDILFTKDKPFDPTIDLQGDSLISNYQVSVYAYGRAMDPKLRFTSSPPLPENEIASLLATGSTAGDPSTAEGVAANRAAFLLISQTYRKLFNKAAPRRRLDEEPSKLSFSFNPLSTGRSEPSVTATYEINPKLQASGTFGGSSFRGLLYYLVRFR